MSDAGEPPVGGDPPIPPEDNEDDYIDDGQSDLDPDMPMDPDHPLLARAQAALQTQLTNAKTQVEEELREKTESLKVATKKREEIGVELYGVQQQLARLQMALEKTHDNYNIINRIRTQAEEELEALKGYTLNETMATDEERMKVDKFQAELDKLTGTLKQIEAYNEQMKNEIAITRRATYTAEESVTKLEKVKKEQDVLIDSLQETLQQKHQQLSLYEAQLEAQQRETKAAKETLAEANSEMEAIHFEKKQLVQQWKSSLIAMARRDEALQATEEALRNQREQELSIEQEIEGYKRSIKGEQQRNEQLTSVLKKVEGQAEYLAKQIQDIKDRKERLQEAYGKLQRSFAQTEDEFERAKQEGKVLVAEMAAADKATVQTNRDIQELETEMLKNLSEQTTVEKTAQKAAHDTQKLRTQVGEAQIQAIQLQNELAKIRVDVLNTEAHNGKLQETLTALDEELEEKNATIEKYEVEIRRRNDEIEKKTMAVDLLNRQFEKLTANMEDENMGPLEATIANLQKEILAKGQESRDLQRRWVGFQSELVSLVNENNTLAEKVARLKSENTVLTQKKVRLEQQYDQQKRDIKGLDAAVLHMHNDMTRLNTLISKNTELQGLLANDNFNLETKIVTELREMEGDAARMESKIQGAHEDKKEILAEIVETERQIMLWERKIELEKEMQAAIDPNVGNDVVGAMKKEIHRMKLRHAELLRIQEKLIQDMERSVYKRETIANKGKATQNKGGHQAEMTEASLRKACAELKRSIRETEAEGRATESRISQLTHARDDIAHEMEEIGGRCAQMAEEEEGLRGTLSELARERTRAVYRTSKYQRVAKRYEQWEGGRYQPSGGLAELEGALDQARGKQDLIRQLIEGLQSENPHLDEPIDRVALHLAIA